MKGFETNTGSLVFISSLFNEAVKRNQNQTAVRKSALILHSITTQKIGFYRLTANKIIRNTPWGKKQAPAEGLKVGGTLKTSSSEFRIVPWFFQH